MFDHSPYLEQRPFFEKLAREEGAGRFNAVWETNRGCPFTCSFCYWGAGDRRIREIGMGRVEKEAEWFSEMKTQVLFLIDANFGILPRDSRIMDLLLSAKKRTGYPRFLGYTPTKKASGRDVEIALKAFEAGFITSYTLPLQHTDERVLAVASRANISLEKQIEIVQVTAENDMPLDVHLILGIPGDTYKRWKTCFTDLMERGIHEYNYIFLYDLLPNTPANDKAFIEKWEIETVERRIPLLTQRGRKKDEAELYTEKIIVETKSFSREDWVKMRAYAAAVCALHGFSLLRCVSLYLRFTHGVPFGDFYENVIEGFSARDNLFSGLYRKIIGHYEDFLAREEAMAEQEVEQLPELQWYLESGRWLYVQICLHFERFFDEVREFLAEIYPGIGHLEDLLEFQKQIVILTEYDRDSGKSFPVRRDWVRYFEEAMKPSLREPLEEPAPCPPGSVVEATDRHCHHGPKRYEFDWNQYDGAKRWERWIERTVLFTGTLARNNLARLSIRRGDGTPSDP